jgi:hypothetical protein
MELFGQDSWNVLLERIADKKCTPFIGAGASATHFPVGAKIAEEWARESGYPLGDATDLTRVAQYLAIITKDPMWPKDRICKRIRSVGAPSLDSPDDPHHVLAALDLPVYLTTNYDGLMTQALKERGKSVQESICVWNRSVSAFMPPRFSLDPAYTPTSDNPLVYHLHGHYEFPESIVLTEDDYLDYLIRIAHDEDLLPLVVRKAFMSASLLFVGYRIADWNFRVLFRSLVTYLEYALGRSHYSVQSLPREDELSEDGTKRAQDYLIRYFDRQNITVFWGYSQEFAAELGRRWRDLHGG